MVWHPFKKLLVAGWETSEISVRNETERETYQYTYQTAFPNMPDSNQQQSIKFISFSSKGSYLYIVDAVSLYHLRLKIFHDCIFSTTLLMNYDKVLLVKNFS